MNVTQTSAISPVITTERQRELIDKVTQLAARGAKEELEIENRDAARAAQAAEEYQRRRGVATAEFESRHAELIAEYKAAREDAFWECESAGCLLAQEEDRFSEAASEQLTGILDAAKNVRQHRYEQIVATFKERELIPKGEFAQFKQQCEYSAGEINALVIRAQSMVRRRGAWQEETPPSPPLAGLSKQEYLDRFSAALGRAFERVAALQNLPTARFLEEGWPVLLFVVAFVGGLGLLSLWVVTLGWAWIAIASLGFALVLALGVRQAVRPIARRQTVRIVPQLQGAVAEARASLAAALNAARVAGEAAHRQLVEKRDHDLAAAKAEYKQTRREQKALHHARMAQAAAEFAARRKTIEDAFEQKINHVEESFPRKIEEFEQNFEQKIVELSERYRQERVDSRREFDRQRSELAASWAAGLSELQQVADAMNGYCGRHFPAWDEIDGEKQQPQPEVPSRSAAEPVRPPADELSALRFGHFDFDLHSLEGVRANGKEWSVPQTSFQLPAVLSYPQCPSLLLEAEGDGRDQATRVIQNVMLRLLTSFPPGKVRFTIIDPVGLGQNFSAFMHLADYDERLVANRIWTESAHINQRLADLTEHMENVIQKYLRNEFASIQEYNEYAGEVAEPFQILVIANFPANFSEEAARRLASIAASGARCGVYTLISVDTKLKMPRNFDLTDLESQAATVVWDADQGRLHWKYDDLKRLPLTLDAPPDDDRFTSIVRAIGRLAKDAARVEVPFESVVPAPGHWWSADSRGEIEVPLGRAGATKLQYLRLGKGTSQHVLIAGKTGSGKSTLLNALITNLALHYSPGELEFYLIDFKKGVEFKAYATYRLPHAHVIAIESEREFGMSVLERLDVELRRRGDLFRQHGVQDLKGFRNAAAGAAIPRILLVIDEFQEFFTNDDKISHDASLLLDRLVRQGRAFGIHVLLGSQTLAGAYTLARSTIGQMAVRIALQCSESDAHLILSEDNTAARLLSRPGEAIYNDANGLFEGNHPFQVVWLPDHQRETYLRRLGELAVERNLSLALPTIFEGNVAADPRDNLLLLDLLSAAAPTASSSAPRAWLGAAVAIKDPTQVVFRRQAGSNLLIVGQQEELALGILHSCLTALAGQVRGESSEVKDQNHEAGNTKYEALPRFSILDGARADSPEAGFWSRVCRQTAWDAEIASPHNAAQTIGRIATEVDRRLTSGEHAAEPLFVVIYNLSRFRDLKKSDDFALSGFGDEGSADAPKQLATILREGSAVGIHALIWCDSYNSVNRWLDRQALRDLEMRVLFQMSAADSSNLMDSPAASRLGVHTAICFSEAHGEAEKFRPYGLPSTEWLAWVAERFTLRASARKDTNVPPAGEPVNAEASHRQAARS